MRICIGAIVFLISVLLASSARAADDFSIDLVGADEHPPLIVCLALPVAPTPEDVDGRPEEWKFVQEVFGFPGAPCAEPVDVPVMAKVDPHKPKKAPKAVTSYPWTWEYGSCGRPVDDAPVQSTERRASAALRAPPTNDVIFRDRSVCRPSIVELRSTDIVQCKYNPLSGPAAKGVAVIALDSSQLRKVSFFNVDHNIVTVHFDGAASGSAVTARLAGGDYQTTAVKLVEADRVQLPLEPRCYERSLLIPPVDTQGGAAAASVSIGPWTATIDHPSQRNTILLPPTSAGESSTLGLEFSRSISGARVVDAKFETGWSTRAPPQKLDLRATEVTFGWAGPCEYPFKEECPSVRLAETGEVRKSDNANEKPVDGVCGYRFTAAPGGTISLPAELTFESARLPSWRAKVSRPGVRLSDYVAPEARMFRVVMPWALRSNMRADQIDSIELVGPTGTRQTVPPESDALVAVPFGACHGTLGYHLFGRRDYRSGNAKIENGHILIESPADTASLASLGLMLGGGFEVALARAETRPYAQTELSLRVKPTRWGSAETKWEMPWYTRPDIEIGVTYIFTPQPYSPLRTPDNAADKKVETVPYNRFLLGAFLLWPIGDVVFLGPGIGGGLGYALRESDSGRVGGVQFFAAPGARLRYDISRRFALVSTSRLLVPDELQKFESTNDFRGAAERTSTTQSWFFFDFALQGWL